MVTPRGNLKEEDGQSLVEYAMIIFLIALIAVGALGVFGARANTMYLTIVRSF
jgi:Flp pilus assembly pilin Flp